MSDRVKELAERRAALQLRCAAQRRAIASEVRAIEARLGTIDRFGAAARGVLGRPIVVAAAFTALAVLARVRGLRFIGRALMLAAGVRRLLQAAKQI